MAKGGYRKPANPAQVSGPGALSRRTDGKQPVMNMTGGSYGESKALREQQQGAPMLQAEQNPMTGGMPSMPSVTPLFSPTERPDEPMTAGVPFGPGENSLPSITQAVQPSVRDTIMKALQFADDPELENAFAYLANNGTI